MVYKWFMLNKSLSISLISTLTFYVLVSSVLFGALGYFFNLPSFWYAWFFPLNLVFQVGLGFVVFLLGKYAVHSPSGLPLKNLGIANKLTLLRLSLFPCVIFLFVLTKSQPDLGLSLIIITMIAFLTDLLDGWLSRTLKLISDLGRILDSSSDYLLMFSLTLIFVFFGILPLWLFLIIALRIAFQTLGMGWLTLKYKKLFLKTTLWGKISFFALMVLYVFEISLFFELPGLKGSWLHTTLEFSTAGLILVSMVDKFLFFQSQVSKESKV